jgi:hypothetical protein
MEILILIAIIAVGVSALYVAIKFDARTKQVIDPLVNKATESIINQIKATNQKLEQQALAITSAQQQQQQDGERVERIEKANGELKQQVQAIADQMRQDRDLVKHLGEQIDARQGRLNDQLGSGLPQLDRHVTQLIESLIQQSAQIAEIRNYVKRQGKQAQSSTAKDSLLLAMLEAESHVDCKGWGQPPHLYALTETTSPKAADHELADEIRDARPNALVPVEQGPLPHGDLIDGLVKIHWPEDVVGCVLVTELVDLPPRSAGDPLIDPVAAGQWASTHPDARPARLVVGVRRSGEHKCGLRIKGEGDVQVRTELVDDLVTALLGTF